MANPWSIGSTIIDRGGTAAKIGDGGFLLDDQGNKTYGGDNGKVRTIGADGTAYSGGTAFGYVDDSGTIRSGMRPVASVQFAPTQTASVTQAVQDQNKGTVQGQIKGLIDANSPLMQRAAQSGLDLANSRGLVNSGMAIGSAQNAVYDHAVPIATSDAGFNNQFALTNAGEANTTARFNAGEGNKVGMFNAGEANNLNLEKVRGANQLANTDKQGGYTLQNTALIGENQLANTNMQGDINSTATDKKTTSDYITSYNAGYADILRDPNLDDVAVGADGLTDKGRALQTYKNNFIGGMQFISAFDGIDVDSLLNMGGGANTGSGGVQSPRLAGGGLSPAQLEIFNNPSITGSEKYGAIYPDTKAAASAAAHWNAFGRNEGRVWPGQKDAAGNAVDDYPEYPDSPNNRYYGNRFTSLSQDN